MAMHGNDDPSSGKNGNSGNPSNLTFGLRLRQERLSRGWTLADLGARTGYAAGALSRIENSKRPATAQLAIACDRALPELAGWFSANFEASRSLGAAPWFIPWIPHENRAMEIREFTPGVPGLLQTEGYARALFSISPDATPEVTSRRVAARMERQKRLFGRMPAPSLLCLIDELGLRREAGPGVMAAQIRHLINTAQRPAITIQLIPPMLHPGSLGSIILADGAALLETHAGGQVFEDADTVMRLERRFEKIRSEAYGAMMTLRRLEGIARELDMAQEHSQQRPGRRVPRGSHR
jgi:transcriptional regulator with XRE-family HTH domain